MRIYNVELLINKSIPGCGNRICMSPDRKCVFASTNCMQSTTDAFRSGLLVTICFHAMAKIKTEEKDAAFDALVANMTTQLQQSEVDTANDPGKLELIGWGKKTPAQPSNPPNQPRSLEALMQGPGTVYLDWKTPMIGGKGGRSAHTLSTAANSRKAAAHSAVGNKQAWYSKHTPCFRINRNVVKSNTASSPSTVPESVFRAIPRCWCYDWFSDRPEVDTSERNPIMSQFKIDVEGYLTSIPAAAFRPQDVVRELVTNAIQSCAIAQRIEGDLQPRIDVEMPDRLRLQITDNGVGFHPMILQRLGDLHISKWTETTRLLGISDVERRGYGRFGMGLTSTINVCDELLILSRPVTDKDTTYCWWTNWRSGWFLWKKGENPTDVDAKVQDDINAVLDYTKRSDLSSHGARVVLKLKDDVWRGKSFLDIEQLKRQVLYYFSAISMPIHVGGASRPITNGVTGWRVPGTADPRTARQIVSSWLESRSYEREECPENDLHCFEITAYDGISGVIWLRRFRPDTVHFFAREVYASDIPALLPEGGGFISAIVNDDKAILDITKQGLQIATEEGARREGLIRARIQNTLEEYVEWLNAEYSDGNAEQRRQITEIGSRYGRAMLAFLSPFGSARILDTAGRATVWIPLPLITSRKHEVLAKCEVIDPDGHPAIYYADSDTDLRRVQLFQQRYIIDARHHNDKAILKLYADTHTDRGVRIERVMDPAINLITPLNDLQIDELGFKALIEAIKARWDGQVTLADIAPQLGEAFAHIVQPSDQSGEQELVLNKKNGALKILKKLSDDDLVAAAAHIVTLAVLLQDEHIAGDEFERVSESLTRMIEALKGLGERGRQASGRRDE
ncbi:MAG: ATP-binding protein [Candidatus Hydrogenedentes bacterium]|nr:ATP-binding protein [Candidatus Hydrogenedentota bacterium]